MAKLVVINQALASSAHELGENWTTIGRADGNAFQIVEGSVSGRHCEGLRFPSSPPDSETEMAMDAGTGCRP
jgi:hypothetical protein